jgi:hypothetical protein
MRRSAALSFLCMTLAFGAAPSTRAALATGAPPLGDYHARSRAVIEEVLAAREFAEADGTSWADGVWERIAGFFRGLLDRVDQLPAWLGTLDAAGELYGVRDLDPDRVYAEAHRRLAQGDWSGAVRFLYVAAILRLDRVGFVRLRQSKTNHDYVRELAARPDCRGPFEVLTRCFETTVYGGRAADEAACREMTAQMDTLAHAQRPEI